MRELLHSVQCADAEDSGSTVRSEARQVALLRGVNVGGKNRMPMQELREVFTETGCADCETYIQSGNVVFRSSCAAAKLQTMLAAAIKRRFGFASPVVVRSAAELRAVLQRQPFTDVAEDLLAVMFLRDQPVAEALARLEADRFLPERFIVLDREIYLYMPSGAGRSKLTTVYFESRLKTVGTVRNLRTIGMLIEIAEAG